MNEVNIAVFFYGLFMDESLIGSKGVQPSRTAFGYIDGYRLRIGTRATLVAEAAGRVYGVLMNIRRADLAKLYSDVTVADYVPENVSVTLANGVNESAVCYLLPPGKLEGTNPAYAASLLQLATRLGFPEDYLARIRIEGNL